MPVGGTVLIFNFLIIFAEVIKRIFFFSFFFDKKKKGGGAG